MHRYIWLVPSLPLAGAAINGIFGRWFRFPEKLIGGIAVGSVALSFLISLAAAAYFAASETALTSVSLSGWQKIQRDKPQLAPA